MGFDRLRRTVRDHHNRKFLVIPRSDLEHVTIKRKNNGSSNEL